MKNSSFLILFVALATILNAQEDVNTIKKYNIEIAFGVSNAIAVDNDADILYPEITMGWQRKNNFNPAGSAAFGWEKWPSFRLLGEVKSTQGNYLTSEKVWSSNNFFLGGGVSYDPFKSWKVRPLLHMLYSYSTSNIEGHNTRGGSLGIQYEIMRVKILSKHFLSLKLEHNISESLDGVEGLDHSLIGIIQIGTAL